MESSKSTYKSGSGKEVTLYQGPNGKVSVVDGELTVYDERDEMHGAVNLEMALEIVGYTENEGSK